MNTPTLDQLRRGMQIAEQIAALEKQLAAVLGGQPVASSAAAPKKIKRRKISPEGLARIIAAQKKRWGKARAGRKASAAPKKAVAKKKGGITAAGREKLSAAMKARWAARKAGAGPAPEATI